MSNIQCGLTNDEASDLPVIEWIRDGLNTIYIPDPSKPGTYIDVRSLKRQPVRTWADLRRKYAHRSLPPPEDDWWY